MKVIFIANSLYIGGPEIWCLTMAEGLVRAGHQVDILHLGQAVNPEIGQWAERVATVHHVKSRIYKDKNSVMWQDCRAILESMLPADVIVSWGHPMLKALCHSVDIPVVLCSHTAPSWTSQQTQLEQAASGATHFTAVSKTAKETYSEQLRQYVTVIENGVSLDRVAPSVPSDMQRAKWGIAADEVVALYVGRVAAIKRLDRFVLAIRALPANYKGVIVGGSADGTAEPGIHRLVQRYAAGRIRFLPTTTYLGDYLNAADCLVMTSETEAAPLVWYEALATGLPIVTTRHEFAKEFMQNRDNESGGWPVWMVKSDPLSIGQGIREATEKWDVETANNAKQGIWTDYSAPAFQWRWESYLHSVAMEWRNDKILRQREVQIGGVEPKNRLHVIWDRRGWAYFHRAEALAANAPDNWTVTCSGKPPSDLEAVDVVLGLPYGEMATYRNAVNAKNPAVILVAGVNIGPDRRPAEVGRVCALADAVIHNSEASYRARTTEGVVHGWVSNGVDTELFRPGASKTAEREDVALWCGSRYHAKLKGYPRLAALQKTVRIEERLVDSAKAPYSLPQMRDWYRTGKVFLVLSQSEGTPNPALEAAACGCVLVATPVGNMPELIRHYQNGFMFDSTDPTDDEVIEAIGAAIENAENWSNQMLTDIKSWDWSVRAPQYFQWFETLIAGRAGIAGALGMKPQNLPIQTAKS